MTYYRPGSYRGSIYSGEPEGTAGSLSLATVSAEGVALLPDVGFLYLWRP